MNGYQFIASIVSSLSWPAVLVVALFMFKEELVRLLPRLRVKHKETEVSFQLDAAEKEAAALPPAPPTPASEPTPEEKTRFQKLADLYPAGVIQEAWGEIENAVRMLAQETGIGDKRYTSTLAKIRVMRSRNKLDEHTSALLDELRSLRNRTVHDEAAFSRDDALRYRELADRALARLGLLTEMTVAPTQPVS